MMGHYITGGMLLFLITSIIWVKTEITKRPTCNEVDKKYVPKESCDIITKNFQEKLECIPEMKKSIVRIETKLEILLERREKSDDN